MPRSPRCLARWRSDARRILPEAALQLAKVKGLDLTLKQALDFKYITAPISVTDVQGLLDILYCRRRNSFLGSDLEGVSRTANAVAMAALMGRAVRTSSGSRQWRRA